MRERERRLTIVRPDIQIDTLLFTGHGYTFDEQTKAEIQRKNMAADRSGALL